MSANPSIRTRPLACLLAALVLAGCSAPAGPDRGPAPGSTAAGPAGSTPATTALAPTTPAATPAREDTHSSSDPIAVVGDPAPVDVNRVWNRVRAMLGTDVTPPESVVVRPPPRTVTLRPPRFYTTLTGVGQRTLSIDRVSGRVNDPDTVHVRWSPDASSPARFEQVLAHEYAHVVQFRHRLPSGRRLPVAVRGALLQGGAFYVEEAYTDRYLDDASLPSTRLREAYRDASPVERYFLRQNYVGYRYVAAHADSPRDLPAVYGNPPRTTEQMVHRLAPGEEPPVPLRVSVNRSTTGGWIRTGNGTAGELLVRSVLDTRLPESEAASAARGWGNDRLVTYWNGTAYSHVWVVRWDDAANAGEFAGAFERYPSDRAVPVASGWRRNATPVAMERLDSETVAGRTGSPENFPAKENLI